MLLSLLGLVVGLAILAVAADQFVIGAARVARSLKLSPVLIGAVVVGFGTSAPEMIVSGLAAGQGELDIAMGNIIGSNIANLSMILGAAALVTPVVVVSPTIRREAPLALGATVLFAVLVRDGVSRVDGLVLALALVAALVFMIRANRGYEPELTGEVEEYLHDAGVRVAREAMRSLAGLVFTLGSAQLLVLSASDIAERIGLAAGFVGLTIVAVGTSLPELATSLQAARKAETDLIVGNLLGSNLFNSLAVGGIAGLVGPGLVDDAALTGIALLLMIGVGVVATLAMATGRRVERWEGILLIAAWLAMLPLLA